MSTNSSSFYDKYLIHCSDYLDGVYISTASMITRNITLVPLCILVLHLGYQKWKQQRSFRTTSHLDIFTYHTIAMELTLTVGTAIYFVGAYTDHGFVKMLGFHGAFFVMPGQTFFTVLTCMERYLAVVHPVLYLRLKQSTGIKIRNIIISCVWLSSFLWTGLIALYFPNLPFDQFICVIIVSLVIITFSSLRVLCVLISPGPGAAGRIRDRVDQSKRKAFCTILVVLTALWLWFAALLIGLALDTSTLLSHDAGCAVVISATWFGLPCNAVLPMLFLHRAGKLVCCC